MDYHSMKRKELQALCKKHNIPANTTNSAMADKLSELLHTSLKSSVEAVEEKDSGVGQSQAKSMAKKVDDGNIVESINEGGEIPVKRMVQTFGNNAVAPANEKKRRRGTVKDIKKENEAVKEGEVRPVRVTRLKAQTLGKDSFVPLNEEKQGRRAANVIEKENETFKESEVIPVRVTRLKAQTLGKDGGVPLNEKKQGRRAVEVTGKENEAVKETEVSRIRVTRLKAQILEDGVVPDLNPQVKKKSGRGVTKDKVNIESSKEIVDNSVRVTRSREQQSKDDIGNPVADPQVENKRARRELKVADRSSKLTVTSSNAVPEDNQEVPKRKSSRNREVEISDEDGSENLKHGRRKTRSKDSAAEVSENEKQVDKGLRRPRRNGANVEDSTGLNTNVSKVEGVTKGKITRSRVQLAATSLEGNSKSETEIEVGGHRESELVHQLKEPLEHAGRRNVNQIKSVMPTPEYTEAVRQLEEPVNHPSRKGSRRKSVMQRAEEKGNDKPVAGQGKTVKESVVVELPNVPSRRSRRQTVLLQPPVLTVENVGACKTVAVKHSEEQSGNLSVIDEGFEDEDQIAISGEVASRNETDAVAMATGKQRSRKRRGDTTTEEQVCETEHASPVDKSPRCFTRSGDKSEGKASAPASSRQKKPRGEAIEIASACIEKSSRRFADTAAEGEIYPTAYLPKKLICEKRSSLVDFPNFDVELPSGIDNSGIKRAPFSTAEISVTTSAAILDDSRISKQNEEVYVKSALVSETEVKVAVNSVETSVSKSVGTDTCEKDMKMTTGSRSKGLQIDVRDKEEVSASETAVIGECVDMSCGMVNDAGAASNCDAVLYETGSSDDCHVSVQQPNFNIKLEEMEAQHEPSTSEGVLGSPGVEEHLTDERFNAQIEMESEQEPLTCKDILQNHSRDEHEIADNDEHDVEDDRVSTQELMSEPDDKDNRVHAKIDILQSRNMGNRDVADDALEMKSEQEVGEHDTENIRADTQKELVSQLDPSIADDILRCPTVDGMESEQELLTCKDILQNPCVDEHDVEDDSVGTQELMSEPDDEVNRVHATIDMLKSPDMGNCDVADDALEMVSAQESSANQGGRQSPIAGEDDIGHIRVDTPKELVSQLEPSITDDILHGHSVVEMESVELLTCKEVLQNPSVDEHEIADNGENDVGVGAQELMSEPDDKVRVHANVDKLWSPDTGNCDVANDVLETESEQDPSANQDASQSPVVGEHDIGHIRIDTPKELVSQLEPSIADDVLHGFAMDEEVIVTAQDIEAEQVEMSMGNDIFNSPAMDGCNVAVDGVHDEKELNLEQEPLITKLPHNVLEVPVLGKDDSVHASKEIESDSKPSPADNILETPVLSSDVEDEGNNANKKSESESKPSTSNHTFDTPILDIDDVEDDGVDVTLELESDSKPSTADNILEVSVLGSYDTETEPMPSIAYKELESEPKPSNGKDMLGTPASGELDVVDDSKDAQKDGDSEQELSTNVQKDRVSEQEPSTANICPAMDGQVVGDDGDNDQKENKTAVSEVLFRSADQEPAVVLNVVGNEVPRDTSDGGASFELSDPSTSKERLQTPVDGNSVTVEGVDAQEESMLNSNKDSVSNGSADIDGLGNTIGTMYTKSEIVVCENEHNSLDLPKFDEGVLSKESGNVSPKSQDFGSTCSFNRDKSNFNFKKADDGKDSNVSVGMPGDISLLQVENSNDLAQNFPEENNQHSFSPMAHSPESEFQGFSMSNGQSTKEEEMVTENDYVSAVKIKQTLATVNHDLGGDMWMDDSATHGVDELDCQLAGTIGTHGSPNREGSSPITFEKEQCFAPVDDTVSDPCTSLHEDDKNNQVGITTPFDIKSRNDLRIFAEETQNASLNDWGSYNFGIDEHHKPVPAHEIDDLGKTKTDDQVSDLLQTNAVASSSIEGSSNHATELVYSVTHVEKASIIVVDEKSVQNVDMKETNSNIPIKSVDVSEEFFNWSEDSSLQALFATPTTTTTRQIKGGQDDTVGSAFRDNTCQDTGRNEAPVHDFHHQWADVDEEAQDSAQVQEMSDVSNFDDQYFNEKVDGSGGMLGKNESFVMKDDQLDEIKQDDLLSEAARTSHNIASGSDALRDIARMENNLVAGGEFDLKEETRLKGHLSESKSKMGNDLAFDKVVWENRDAKAEESNHSLAWDQTDARTCVITGATPNKLVMTSDMKENTKSLKGEHTARSTIRRRALGDLQRK